MPPLLPKGPHRGIATNESESPDHLDVSNPADGPLISLAHGVADNVATRFAHVELQQGAGVQVEPQGSWSRSASTIAEAGLSDLAISVPWPAGPETAR